MILMLLSDSIKKNLQKMKLEFNQMFIEKIIQVNSLIYYC